MPKKYLLLLFVFQLGFCQENTIATWQSKLNNETKATKKLEILNEMVALAFENDIAQALVFAKQGVAVSEKTNDKNWLPKFYEMEGRMHANLLQLDAADLFFNKAFQGYRAIDDKKGEAKTLFKMAWVLKKKGSYDNAMQKDMAGLKLMETIGDKAGICDALTRISEDLKEQKRPKEAMDYALRAIQMAENNKLEYEKYYAYFNAGYVAIENESYQEALAYFKKAYATSEKIGMGRVSLVDLSNALGNAYKKLERYPDAIEQYKTAMKLAKETNYPNGEASIANLGEVYLLMGNYKQALKYQLLTVAPDRQKKDRVNLVENYEHFSTIYEKLGDYKSALSYHQKAYVLRDSLSSAQSDAKMSELLTKYEADKKEATIETQQVKISKQKMVQWLGAGVLTLLVGFIVFGYIAYRNRTSSNQLLSVKNAENELLMKEIHHRVKNNLEVVSSLLALQSAQIDDPNTKEAMTEGQNRVNSIGIVHQKLYQGTNLGAVEMKDYFLNLGESILDSFGVEGRIELQLAMKELDLDIDTAVPLGLIINELLTNTVKYAFPNGEKGNITIQLEKQNNYLHLEVADNGVGKSGIIKGTGFGTQLIALLTNQLNGTMMEENINGTRIIFDFKLSKAA